MSPKQPADSPRKPSQVLKRSINIAGHKTSVSLEDAFWGALREIAATRRIPLSDLVSTIDNERQHGNLSSTIRAVCSRVLSRLGEHPPGPPMTLGDMRELVQRLIAFDDLVTGITAPSSQLSYLPLP